MTQSPTDASNYEPINRFQSNEKPRQTRKQTAPKRRPPAPRSKPVPADDQSQWLRAVFQHSALGIARLDRNARVLDANAAFERFFDRSLAELKGRPIGEFAAAEDSASIVAMVAEASGGCEQSAACAIREHLKRQVRLPKGRGLVAAYWKLGEAGEVED